jgi:hypothetical protein
MEAPASQTLIRLKTQEPLAFPFMVRAVQRVRNRNQIQVVEFGEKSRFP